MNDIIDIELQEVDLGLFKQIFEPAQLVDNKITFNIDLTTNKIYGVAGGSDKYKFWSNDLAQVCKNVVISDNSKANKIIRTVVLDIKTLQNVMREAGDGVSLTFKTREKDNCLETFYLLVTNKRLKINVSCPPLVIGSPLVTAAYKEEKLGEFGETFKFQIQSNELSQLKSLSNIQTVEQFVDRIQFTNESGKLKVSNDVFENVFEDIDVPNTFTNYAFKTSMFAFIENDTYNVTITSTPSNVKKIIFESTSRDIQFACSLLVSVDDSVTEEAIDNEFGQFFNK